MRVLSMLLLRMRRILDNLVQEGDSIRIPTCGDSQRKNRISLRSWQRLRASILPDRNPNRHLYTLMQQTLYSLAADPAKGSPVAPCIIISG